MRFFAVVSFLISVSSLAHAEGSPRCIKQADAAMKRIGFSESWTGPVYGDILKAEVFNLREKGDMNKKLDAFLATDLSGGKRLLITSNQILASWIFSFGDIAQENVSLDENCNATLVKVTSTKRTFTVDREKCRTNNDSASDEICKAYFQN